MYSCCSCMIVQDLICINNFLNQYKQLLDIGDIALIICIEGQKFGTPGGVLRKERIMNGWFLGSRKCLAKNEYHIKKDESNNSSWEDKEINAHNRPSKLRNWWKGPPLS